jgi:selenide,water dikinase
MSAIKLTEYSHGAGCGCKIAPQVLDTILKSQIIQPDDGNLLVGNSSKDDAAVYDLGDGTAVISTTDFFMPIADDPFTFGRIAAANAISDIYAMGGVPLMAIAILGWPISKLSPEVAQQVVDGGRDLCREAGILLAGGHSIDSPEPIFGLAVTGRVTIENMKQNNTARAGDLLYLTKPVGVGILTTAQKQKKLTEGHENIAIENMCKLNSVGAELGKIEGVNAMTDVTGFGLMGHLSEVCQGSGVAADIQLDRIPTLPHVMDYLSKGCIPGGTLRNYASYGHLLGAMDESVQHLLCDPQTSGGLLISVAASAQQEVEALLNAQGLYAESIGQLREAQGDVLIEVL